MTCKTTETDDITETIELAIALEQWIKTGYSIRTDNNEKAKSAWCLYESMEKLSNLFWDIYHNEFMDKCLLQCQSNQNCSSENEMLF